MSFRAPTHTQTPNELFALLPEMSDTELKVTLVIVRDTFGWQAGGAATVRSLTELQQLTGLSRQGVINGLQAGMKRGTLYKTEGSRNKAAYGLVVNSVDQSIPLTNPLSRPELVNSVDQSGQPSRPSVVNSVDRSTPPGAAPSAGKRAPERQQKDSERKERKTTAGTQASPAPAAAASNPSGETVIGASGTGAPDGAALATGVTGHGSDQPPANAETEPATSTDTIPGAALAALTGALAPMKPLDLIAEYAKREAWLTLTPDRIRHLRDEARDKHGRNFRGGLIEALDAEVRPSAPTTPTPSSVNDRVRARLQGVKS